MKKILLIIICWIPMCSIAQESQLNSFFDKYSGKEGYTSVQITKYMFDIFKMIESEEEENEFNQVVSNLTSIKILTVDSIENLKSRHNFGKELLGTLSNKIYKELMIVKDGSETITFLIREKDDYISEFIMTVDGSTEPVLIYLEGKIDLKQLSKLSKSMNISGFEHLNKVENK